MSIEAKTKFISNMKERLSGVLTVSAMDQMLNALSDEMGHYDISLSDAVYGGKDDMLDAYLSALTIEGRSPKTIYRYNYVISRLLKSVLLPVCEISVYDIRRYLGGEKERGISDNTLEGLRQVFSGFFGWLQREGLITVNPTGNIGAIKKKKKVKTIFSEIDVERMKTNSKTLRDKAIVCFLLSTGCRVSEVAGLNRDAIDLVNLECKVLGKGNKERVVYLDQVTGMLLHDYFVSRKDAHPALFIGKGTERLQPGGIRCMLKTLERCSGVENIHPHKFRRTLATNLSRRGMPIEEIAAILGHEKLDTTMKYIVLDQTDIKHAYKKYAS